MNIEERWEPEHKEEETQVREPELQEHPVLRVWWTAHMKSPSDGHIDHFYVTRSGYWHGTVLGLVTWFTEHAESLRVPCEAFKLMPESIGVRDWPSTLDMLNAAAAQLEDDVPTLLPLPPGKGILYISGHVSEDEWGQIRDAAHGRSRLRGL